MEYINSQHSTRMKRNLEDLLENGHLSDITLIADGRKFFCHKVILSLVCPYFSTMFQTPLKESCENTIEVHGVSKEVMESVIHYIYLGDIRVPADNVQGILFAADMMDLQELKNECCEFFWEHIDASNCMGLYKVGAQISCKRLEERAWKYALCNFHDVIGNDEFTNLCLEDLKEYIKSPLLNVTKEEYLVDAVLKWLSNGNEEHADCVFECVHVKQLSRTYLSKLLSHKIVKTSENLSTLLRNILKGVKDATTHNLEPRIFSGLQDGIFILGNSTNIKVCDDHTENVCLTIVPNESDFKCSSVNIPIPLRQRSEDDLCDTVACCNVDNIVCVSGFQGHEDKMWKYDPLYNYWSVTTIFLSYRSSHNLVVCGKDTLYAVGGVDPYLDIFDEQIEQLNLSLDQSKEVGTLHMPVKWGGCVSYDDKILLFGGETWDYINSEPEACDLIQMFDTSTCQTTVLHTRLFAPTDVARAVVYSHKIILMDSESSWILDCPQLIANQRDSVVNQIVKPGSDSVYFSTEIVDDKLVVVAGESGHSEDNTDLRQVKVAPVKDFIVEGKEVEWQTVGQLYEPLKVCATCRVRVKIN